MHVVISASVLAAYHLNKASKTATEIFTHSTTTRCQYQYCTLLCHPKRNNLVVSLAMASLNVYVSFYSSLFKSLFTLAFARLYTPQKPSKRDLSGQTAITTGANSGIGLSIAVQ